MNTTYFTCSATLLFFVAVFSGSKLYGQAVAPGDSVVVVAPTTNVMVGQDAVAAVMRGQRLRVSGVRRSWLLITYSVRGRAQQGWINVKDTRLVADSPPQYSQSTPRTYRYYYRAPRWHDTSHDDWHDTSHWDRHGDHYHLHPQGHSHHHRSGHWD